VEGGGQCSQAGFPATPRATLVVCPVSLASQWQEELTKMSAKGSLSSLWYGNDRADVGRLLAQEGKKKVDVIITSYGTLGKRIPAVEEEQG
jgi:DNA repair protein RAD5